MLRFFAVLHMFSKLSRFQEYQQASLYSSDVLFLSVLFLPKIAESSPFLTCVCILIMAKPVHNMKIPVGSAGSPHRRSVTVPPAYPTRVRRTLLTAFHGSYPTSCAFCIRQERYAFHHILQLSKIILAERFKSSWAFDFAAGYVCQSLIP